jgi:hypothetical protein
VTARVQTHEWLNARIDALEAALAALLDVSFPSHDETDDVIAWYKAIDEANILLCRAWRVKPHET